MCPKQKQEEKSQAQSPKYMHFNILQFKQLSSKAVYQSHKLYIKT